MNFWASKQLTLRTRLFAVANVLLTKYYSGDQIEKNEIAGQEACMGRGQVCTRFWWGDLREGDHLEDAGIEGRIILKWIFTKWHGSMD